jgi:hypothetical protein
VDSSCTPAKQTSAQHAGKTRHSQQKRRIIALPSDITAHHNRSNALETHVFSNARALFGPLALANGVEFGTARKIRQIFACYRHRSGAVHTTTAKAIDVSRAIAMHRTLVDDYEKRKGAVLRRFRYVASVLHPSVPRERYDKHKRNFEETCSCACPPQSATVVQRDCALSKQVRACMFLSHSKLRGAPWLLPLNPS